LLEQLKYSNEIEAIQTNIFKYLKFDSSKNEMSWKELKEINEGIYKIVKMKYMNANL